MVALIRKSFQIFRALHPPICAGTPRHSLASLSLLISPTPYPLQASFRVPGDLAREDDLCEEIALIELVSNN